MRVRFAVFLCLFFGISSFFSAPLRAENSNSAPEIQLLETVSAARVDEKVARIFGRGALPAAPSGISLFRVRYASRDAQGRAARLSGLLVLPQDGAPRGLVVANHGTTFDRRLSPSRFRFDRGARETLQVVLAFASGGYGVAMPDYPGLGDHHGARAFPLGKRNAPSALDLVPVARNMARTRGVSLGNRLFLTGYSEGAAVALWAQRELEKREKSAWPTRVAALCGPYDLSGATRVAMLQKPANPAQFGAGLFLVAGAIQSWSQLSQTPLSRYFQPRMALAVRGAFTPNATDESIVSRLAWAAISSGARDWNDVLTPEFLRALRTLDAREPFVRAFRENDVFDWKPLSPTRFLALENDTIVTEQNTKNALGAMKKRGASAVSVEWIRDARLNHISATGPAFLRARAFFDAAP